MFAKLNHVAIISDNYAAQGLFYRALFDLKSGSPARQDATAWSIGDGYVGMNINPRSAGRQAGLDHLNQKGMTIHPGTRVSFFAREPYGAETIEAPSYDHSGPRIGAPLRRRYT